MEHLPKSEVTLALRRAIQVACSRVRESTASPRARRKASVPVPPSALRAPEGYGVLASVSKDPADQTRTIDVLAEGHLLESLRGEFSGTGANRFVVMTEERGILASPEDFDPGSVDRFLLVAIDPVDGTDMILTGFGGAITLVAAEVGVEGRPERRRLASAKIVSTVICDVARGEVFWAESAQEGAFVDFQTGSGDTQTEPLQPAASVRWSEITWASLGSKLGRIRALFTDLGWTSWKGQPLDEDKARCILHHGGPLPLCRVASGDIHAAFDLKGYKPIDLAGGMFLAVKAGCRYAYFGDGAGECDPLSLLVCGEDETIGKQFLKTLLRRQRFCCAASAEVLEYCTAAFFAADEKVADLPLREQVERSRTFLEETFRVLRDAGHHDVALCVERLFGMALPYMIESRDKNPVHHFAMTARFMAEICVGEGAPLEEVKRGVVAALLHDVGQGKEGKIRKADIPAGPEEAREKAIAKAIDARRAHMLEGGRITRLLLSTYNTWFGTTFSPADVAEIVRLVEIHDNPSIQEYQDLSRGPAAQTWLFDPRDRQAMRLRSADRMFMVSREGIAVDLQRDLAKARAESSAGKGSPKDMTPKPKSRISDNIARHHEEGGLYRRVLKAKADTCDFWCGLLHQGDAAYAVFLRELRGLEKAYDVDIAELLDIRSGDAGQVRIAGLATMPFDYRLYQLKNHPATTDLAATVVMGMPFAEPFVAGLKNLVDELAKILSGFPWITFHPYGPQHLHATVAPARRTRFDRALCLRDPEEMARRQRDELDRNPPDSALIGSVVAGAAPFDIEVESGKILINGKGEVLLWGSAKSRRDRQGLADLRERLKKTAKLDGRDTGSAIHGTLGTIQDFHRLAPADKREIAEGIRQYLDSPGHQRYLRESGTTRIDRVKLVYYGHRSLRREDKPGEEFPLLG